MKSNKEDKTNKIGAMTGVKHFTIKPSKNGKGVFARKKFKKGELLFWVKGKIYHFVKLYEKGDVFQDNTFRFGQNTYLSPQGELGDFLNHSCVPNASVVKINRKLYLQACKNITKNQEILMDYSTILAADDVWTMRCKCGEPKCRKIIKKFTMLPKYLQQEYIAQKLVPRYILKIKP